MGMERDPGEQLGLRGGFDSVMSVQAPYLVVKGALEGVDPLDVLVICAPLHEDDRNGPVASIVPHTGQEAHEF